MEFPIATPSGLWILAAAVAGAGLVTALAVRARVNRARRSPGRAGAEVPETVRPAPKAETGPGHRAGAEPGRREPDDLVLAPEAWERQRLLQWIAAGQQLVGLIRTALRNHDRLQREVEVAKRECERLRRELVLLQAERDHLLRERAQFAQALATFVHEAGPRALLGSPRPPAGEDPRP